MRLARALLWLAVLTFAGFGLAFTLFPDRLAAVVDIRLPTDTARADFMGTYGGFELGFAAFLALCARRDEHVGLGLLASGCALAGFAAARLLGMATAQDPKPILLLLLLAEIVGAGLSFWGAGRAGSPSPRDAFPE